jgi:hypothetical protein
MSNVVTCKFSGRLGNNLFQICNLLAYAKKYELPYFIPKESTDQSNGLLPIDIQNTGENPINKNQYFEPKANYNSPFGGENPYFHEIPLIQNIELCGYYQSFKYFDWCRDYILDTVNLPYTKIKKVSIHIRRGDCIGQPDTFPILPFEYYINAVKYFNNLGYYDFYVFSDDIAWCQEMFNSNVFKKSNFTFSIGKSDIHDLILMSSCEHNITARSTFSFMAAWFNRNEDKIVVCDKNPHYFKTCNIDLLPDYFVKLDTKNMYRIKLPNVTLIAIATKDGDVEKTVEALKYSCKEIDFGEVKLVSHYKPDNLPDYIKYEEIFKMADIDEWNHYLFYYMWKHVDTEFGLLVHSDGFVVNPHLWRDEFLDYDYIGSPWQTPERNDIFRDINGELIRVGNSVSIRSRKLMKLPYDLAIPWRKYEGNYNEDTQICVHNRHIFLENGIKFADVDIAKYFGREMIIPEGEGIEPFLFHRYHYPGHPNFNYPRF